MCYIAYTAVIQYMVILLVAKVSEYIMSRLIRLIRLIIIINMVDDWEHYRHFEIISSFIIYIQESLCLLLDNEFENVFEVTNVVDVLRQFCAVNPRPSTSNVNNMLAKQGVNQHVGIGKWIVNEKWIMNEWEMNEKWMMNIHTDNLSIPYILPFF